MRRTLPLLTALLLAPATAWPALQIGEFTLGMPKHVVVETLGKHFSTVELVSGSHYQVTSLYYQAKAPTDNYRLKGAPIQEVQATFNEAGELKQLQVSLATTDPAFVHQVIPLTQQANEVPDTSGRYEAMFEDGELVYYISNLSDTAVVTIADKATSAENIQARARSDERFKKINEGFDSLINTMKRNEVYKQAPNR